MRSLGFVLLSFGDDRQIPRLQRDRLTLAHSNVCEKIRSFDRDRVQLTVADDGRGFDPGATARR
jgi:hypothetical protein